MAKKEEGEKSILDFAGCKSLKDAEKVLMSYYGWTKEELYESFTKDEIQEYYASVSSVQYAEVDFQDSFGKNTMKESDGKDNSIAINIIKESIDELVNENLKFMILKSNSGTEFLIDYPIQVKKFKHPLRVFYSHEMTLLCYDADKNIISVNKNDVKHNDNVMDFFQKEEISYVFQVVTANLIEKAGLEFIECFMGFCSYFNADERILYDSIDLALQEKLVRELSSRANLSKGSRRY